MKQEEGRKKEEVEVKIRVRIAPSPTGFMHIGTLRTALTNYLFARKHGGRFIVRLEDTDQKRYVQGSTEDLLRSLAWSGMSWDEGIFLEQGQIVEKGEFGPYVQSDRLSIYRQYALELVDRGLAYYCFCSADRLEKMRKEQQRRKEAPMYDRACLRMPKSEIQDRLRRKEEHVIRMLVPREETTRFKDLVRGSITIENRVLDDQVLIKSDGYPTYHFAVVVDDYLMKISHVLRAEEWLPSTPKHIILYEMFGWPVPQFGHLPQLLNLNGKKLSKRDGDVAVRDFIAKGYLPEAVINFIALLGWNPKTTQEIFSLKELVEVFDLAKINKAGAKFDYSRLDWFGSQYIKKLSVDDIYKASRNHFDAWHVSREKALRIVGMQRERIAKLSDVTTGVEYLLDSDISYDPGLLNWKNMDNAAIIEKLTQAAKVIRDLPEDRFELELLQESLLKAAGDQRGEMLWPLRVALTGQKQSPSPFECLWILGKAESLKRIEKALHLIA